MVSVIVRDNESFEVYTTNILFICGGAFVGLEEIKEDNRILNNQLEHHLKIKEKMHYTI